jgi:Carbohydrate binding domain
MRPIRLIVLTLLLVAIATCAHANQAAQGWCEDGAQPVVTSGLSSLTLVQYSAPQCTVTVYLHGTTTKATLYSDNNVSPTPLSNPFTAATNGQWTFYAGNNRYDILLSGGIVPNAMPATVTYSDIILFDCTVSGACGSLVDINGIPVINPNFQDSSSFFYSVSGSNIQLLPQYSEVGPVGMVNGNFVAPFFYPTCLTSDSPPCVPPNPPQGWSPDVNSTLSYDLTTAPANNEFSIKITCITSGQECGMNNMVLQTLIPGQTYTATAYVRGDGTIGTQLAWEFERSADPTGDLACFSTPVISTTWTFVSVSCTAGNQDNGFVFVTQNSDGPSTAGNMWVQDIQVFANNVSGPLAVTGNLSIGGTLSVTGNSTLSGSLSVGGVFTALSNSVFSGPSPWIDITAAPYGAKCDGSTNDTTAISNALAAAESTPAGTVFSPPGKTCIISTRLVMDGYTGVAVIGGFGSRALTGNTQSTWKFTGTCSTGACLSMRSTTAVNFSYIGLDFSGATTGPFIDLSHFNSSDTSLDAFHGVAFSGPGPTVGPVIFDQNTDSVTIDGWSSFYNASVYIEGPANNAALYTDTTVLDQVVMGSPGIAAIENASIKWSIKHIIAQLGSGSSCVPFLSYVNSYTNEGNLSITDSTFEPGQTAPCTNAFNVINTPAVVLANNFGGITFNDNLVLFDTGSTTGNAISLGNNQFITSYGNTFSQAQAVFAVGTGVSADIGPNNYAGSVSLFTGGFPATGRAIDENGIQHQYIPFLAVGTQTITGCSLTTPLGGSWAGSFISGVSGTCTVTITPGITANNGFSCWASDLTTTADNVKQTSYNPTAAVLSGTTVSGDVVTWGCVAF